MQLYKKKKTPLEKFFIFSIYQNYTLALKYYKKNSNMPFKSNLA